MSCTVLEHCSEIIKYKLIVHIRISWCIFIRDIKRVDIAKFFLKVCCNSKVTVKVIGKCRKCACYVCKCIGRLAFVKPFWDKSRCKCDGGLQISFQSRPGGQCRCWKNLPRTQIYAGIFFFLSELLFAQFSFTFCMTSSQLSLRNDFTS